MALWKLTQPGSDSEYEVKTPEDDPGLILLPCAPGESSLRAFCLGPITVELVPDPIEASTGEASNIKTDPEVSI